MCSRGFLRSVLQMHVAVHMFAAQSSSCAYFCSLLRPLFQCAHVCSLLRPPLQCAHVCSFLRPPLQCAHVCSLLRPPFCGQSHSRWSFTTKHVLLFESTSALKLCWKKGITTVSCTNKINGGQHDTTRPHTGYFGRGPSSNRVLLLYDWCTFYLYPFPPFSVNIRTTICTYVGKIEFDKARVLIEWRKGGGWGLTPIIENRLLPSVFRYECLCVDISRRLEEKHGETPLVASIIGGA